MTPNVQTGPLALPRSDLARRSPSKTKTNTNDEQGTAVRQTLSCPINRSKTGVEANALSIDTRTQDGRELEQDRQHKQESKYHSRIPESLLSLVHLPLSHDGLELLQLPRLFQEGRLHRGIQIHQRKVKDHVEFLVLRKDVRRKRRSIVCKGRLPYRDQIVVCGDHTEQSVERTAQQHGIV